MVKSPEGDTDFMKYKKQYHYLRKVMKLYKKERKDGKTNI